MPFPAILLAAGKAKAVADIAKGFATKLGIGDTALDKQRKQHATSLLTAALGGDIMAVGTLTGEAFNESRPKPVRDLAKSALREYVKAVGTLPPQYQSFMSKLGLPTLSPGALQEIVSATPQPSGPSSSTLVPVVIVAVGLAALAFGARKRR